MKGQGFKTIVCPALDSWYTSTTMPKPSGAAPKVAQKSPHTTSNPPSPDSLPPIPQVAGSSVGQYAEAKFRNCPLEMLNML